MSSKIPRTRGKYALETAPEHEQSDEYGGPSLKLQARYRLAMVSRVSFDDWCEIIDAAVDDAKKGDRYAREFLAKYIMGPPPEEAPKIEDHRSVHFNLASLSDTELTKLRELTQRAGAGSGVVEPKAG
ncbi:MAG: hypothetical protein ABIH46_08370 [Chloroflexota bacterium]